MQTATDSSDGRGPTLIEGDLVRFLSPSSWPSDEHGLESAMSEVRSWGLRADLGEHALARHGYMAGTDEQRLADLRAAFADPTVRAIVATRGGAGAYRIVDGLDADAIRADPKPIVGFSDITNVQMAAWARCGLVSIHGCIAGPDSSADVKRLLMSPEGHTIERDPDIETAALTTHGVATGTLVGGNLRELAGFVGTGLPALDGAILFLEDLRHVGIGQIDRNLTQLLRSGSIDRLAGIALGHFEGFEGFVDRDWALLDVLDDRLGPLGIPVLGGLPAGHGLHGPTGVPDQRAMTIGAVAHLDADAGSLRVGACTVDRGSIA